ncbi:MAG: TraB/GumN family protein [bacterium]|nr:TraB/GumN family protein [bacterium]
MSQHSVQLIQDNVHLIENGDAKIYLLGTAHVSRNSAELVEEFIRQQNPDQVCIELCDPRFQSIQDEARWKNTDLFEVIKTGKAYLLMAQLILASFQKSIADKFGIRPGEEMRVAIAEAQAKNIPIFLIDREVRITLKRAWTKAKFLTLLKLFGAGLLSLLRYPLEIILPSVFPPHEVSEEEIEAIKEGDVLQAMVSEFGTMLPGIKEVLIDERDMYMAHRLSSIKSGTAVAVVGAGHVPGILNLINSDINIAELEEIPSPSAAWKVFGLLLPALIFVILIYGFFTAGSETGTQMALHWVILTGTLSAIGAAAAFAHPLTIVSAFLAAPITTLHPAIAAGWVTGLVEAYIRKPKVSDLESVSDDITTLKGVWRNRVTRILLVIALTNIGASIGAYLGAFYMASFLGGNQA